MTLTLLVDEEIEPRACGLLLPLHSPFVGTKDTRGKSGHQVISQAQDHDTAGQTSKHRRVQVVDQPANEERGN